MSKKIIALALVVAMAFLMNGFDPNVKAASNTDKNLTITMWMGSWYADQAPVIEKAFAEANKGFKLHIEPLPINGYLDNAITATLGGTPPDLIDLDITSLGAMQEKKLLKPWNMSGVNLKDFPAGLLNGTKYKGAYYGLPDRVSSQVMIYNKTLFDKAGLPYPTSNWTNADMVRIAKKLTIPAQQQYGIGMAGSLVDSGNTMQSFTQAVWSNGADFMDKKQTKVTLNTPKAIKAIDFWAGLYNREKVTPTGILNYTVSKDIEPMFMEGKIGMFISGQNSLDNIVKSGKVNWGTCEVPGKISPVGGYVLVIPATAKHPNEAATFAKWFVEPANLAKLAIRTPASLAANQLPPWNADRYKIFTVTAMKGKAMPTVSKWYDLQQIIVAELQYVLEGTKTAAQAGKDMTARCNELLAK